MPHARTTKRTPRPTADPTVVPPIVAAAIERVGDELILVTADGRTHAIPVAEVRGLEPTGHSG